MSFHSIESLPPEDRLLFNTFGRGASVPLTHTTITSAFASTVASNPAVTAVQECFLSGTTERSITYGELDRRSSALANLLISKHGVRPRTRVVCVFARRIEMCVFILATLKAGAQYVPIDGGIMVEEALRHVIADSGASVVLSLPEFRDKVARSMPAADSSSAAASIVCMDDRDEFWTKDADVRTPEVDVGGGDGAYVIYTSGTTGKPKGVDVSHIGTCNALLNEPAKLGISVGSNVACVLMLGFDMCAWEILATLMNGGTLHLRGSGRGGSGKESWDACLSRVDTVISTPSGAQKYFPRHAEFPNIKIIVVGGEPCPLPLADEWAPHARFINICGPTEITILNTAHLHQVGKKLTIGKPNPNTNVYILDDEKRPCRIGDAGVMWVGGLGVSRGYVNLPELTASRYVADKFTQDGRMMFNTGDLGKWLPDGSLEHLGRQDDQVKIKGCRVELDGVSASIEKFVHVDKACALKIGEELWGFYAAVSGPVDEAALRAHLAGLLNHYAQPARLLHLPAMPITSRGKIDKSALRGMALGEHVAAREEEKKSGMTTQVVEVTVKQNMQHWSKLDTLEKGGGVIITESSSSSPRSSVLDDDKEAEVVLPPKNGIHGWRWLRHKALTAYRKLFILVFIANLVPFLVMCAGAKSRGGLPVDAVADAVAANLLASVLVRQDHFANFSFWFATLFRPSWTPLWVRRHLARVYHLGGLHSGCAVFATIWWLVFAVQSTVYHFTASSAAYTIDTPTFVLSIVIFLLLAAILVMSYPSIRMKLHDAFELSHRYLGWTALALVWVQIVVFTASVTRSSEDSSLGLAVIKSPALWMLALTTFLIILPWTRLRRVSITPEPLSPHAIRLHFDYASPPPGKSIRLATHPLADWHGFATITDPSDSPSKHFSIIVSKAGDWTAACIAAQPTTLWTKGVLASGVLRIAPLFSRVVLVATGSGIGPCLPVILAKKIPCRVFWSTPNPEETYGAKIIASVRDADPEAVIWNTRERGRPDMALEAYKLYRASGAECVCVISNQKLTSRLVYDLEARGVPAFGPIWDS